MSLKSPLGDIAFPEGVFFRLVDDNVGGRQRPSASPAVAKELATSASGTRIGPLYDSSVSASSKTEEETTPTSSPPASWKSTETNSFCLHQPLYVTDPELSGGCPVINEAEALGRVLQRSRQLPTTWYYSSNHVMVNQERCRRVVAPLTRLAELDAIAHDHAVAMASADRLFHSNPVELRNKFSRPSRRMGENVASGDSIRDIHKKMMKTKSDRNNILHRSYTNMGMATAKGKNGTLYLCQVFRG
jgi:uncharacterized protein YkwD